MLRKIVLLVLSCCALAAIASADAMSVSICLANCQTRFASCSAACPGGSGLTVCLAQCNSTNAICTATCV
jgi:hypothetical protein